MPKKRQPRKNLTDTSNQILVPTKAKKLDDYDKTKPARLTLFEMLLPNDREYSNTVELYDFIPKYHWGKVQRINNKFLDSLEGEFECRGVKYKVKIRPASIEDRNGIERYYYPSKREEPVEDALRKFVADGQQGVFLDEQAGVTFSLYQFAGRIKAQRSQLQQRPNQRRPNDLRQNQYDRRKRVRHVGFSIQSVRNSGTANARRLER